MANSTSTQILLDGVRNCILRISGTLDTSDIAQTVLIDPSTLNYPPARLSLDGIEFSIQDTLAVNLWWDATTPVQFDALTGRGKREKMYQFGGIRNNAGAGVTGKVLYATKGWATGAVLDFDLILRFIKRQTPY